MSYENLVMRLIVKKKAAATSRQGIVQSHRADCPCCGGSLCLSLAETEAGAVLLHCFKGCSAAEIVTALGLELHDLYPRRLPRHGQGAAGFKSVYEWSSAATQAQIVQDAAWAILTQEGDEIEAFERLFNAVSAFKKSARQAFTASAKAKGGQA